MARIRTIKPEFFRHHRLYLAEKETGLPLRMAFAGLWTAVDREGRFKWKPAELKLDCLPYDDIDFGLILDALAKNNFVVSYKVGEKRFGYIPSWSEHQVINKREAASQLPDPNGENASMCVHSTKHVPAHGEREGKGREKEGNTPLTPQGAEPDEIYEAVEMWNSMAAKHNLPEVQKFTEKRKRSLKRRLADCGGLHGWSAACERVADTPGLLGKGNRSWKINFDFMVSESGFTKLMEGNYENFGKGDSKQSAGGRFDQEASADRISEALGLTRSH